MHCILHTHTEREGRKSFTVFMLYFWTLTRVDLRSLSWTNVLLLWGHSLRFPDANVVVWWVNIRFPQLTSLHDWSDMVTVWNVNPTSPPSSVNDRLWRAARSCRQAGQHLQSCGLSHILIYSHRLAVARGETICLPTGPVKEERCKGKRTAYESLHANIFSFPPVDMSVVSPLFDLYLLM